MCRSQVYTKTEWWLIKVKWLMVCCNISLLSIKCDPLPHGLAPAEAQRGQGPGGRERERGEGVTRERGCNAMYSDENDLSQCEVNTRVE